ncbi:hypothetical protein TGME49_248570 [Toxoplasma gondii ME49]|uniref:Trichohyalin n=1 Tax=Toxoplasma gondii (strain ATCC 50611 / Me49) TaxID=508771 RepID=S8ERY9_TOXGM|nr:hypothetical protein TGME49_248570 [Toxoplasma gondii ME49]EPT25022.1 hypothetical protein TGME49_248570 [Toxoplasma gondii ME49]|eukprot:XP_018635007.1 hypothetical protein TGME49_248570 [Toxoplasma gondii ME49]
MARQMMSAAPDSQSHLPQKFAFSDARLRRVANEADSRRTPVFRPPAEASSHSSGPPRTGSAPSSRSPFGSSLLPSVHRPAMRGLQSGENGETALLRETRNMKDCKESQASTLAALALRRSSASYVSAASSPRSPPASQSSQATPPSSSDPFCSSLLSRLNSAPSATAVAAATSPAAVHGGGSPPELLVIARERRRSLPLHDSKSLRSVSSSSFSPSCSSSSSSCSSSSPSCSSSSASSSASASSSSVFLAFAESRGRGSRRVSSQSSGRRQDIPFPSFLSPHWTDAFCSSHKGDEKSESLGVHRDTTSLRTTPSFAELPTRHPSSPRSRSDSSNPFFDGADAAFDACSATGQAIKSPESSQPTSSSSSFPYPSASSLQHTSSSSSRFTFSVSGPSVGGLSACGAPQEGKGRMDPRQAEDVSLFSSNLLHASGLHESLFNLSALDVSAVYGETQQAVSPPLASSIFSFSGEKKPHPDASASEVPASPSAPLSANPSSSSSSVPSSLRSTSVSSSGHRVDSAEEACEDKKGASVGAGQCVHTPRGGGVSMATAGSMPFSAEREKRVEERGTSNEAVVEREHEKMARSQVSPETQEERMRRIQKELEALKERNDALELQLFETQRRRRAAAGLQLKTERRPLSSSDSPFNSRFDARLGDGVTHAQNASEAAAAAPRGAPREAKEETYRERTSCPLTPLPSFVLRRDSETACSVETPRFPTACPPDGLQRDCSGERGDRETGVATVSSAVQCPSEFPGWDRKECKDRLMRSGVEDEQFEKRTGEEGETIEREEEKVGKGEKEREEEKQAQSLNELRTKKAESLKTRDTERGASAALNRRCKERGDKNEKVWGGETVEDRTGCPCILSGEDAGGKASLSLNADPDPSKHAVSDPQRSGQNEAGCESPSNAPEERQEVTTPQADFDQEREALPTERQELEEARAVAVAQKRESEETRQPHAAEEALWMSAREQSHGVYRQQLQEQREAFVNEKEFEDAKQRLTAQKQPLDEERDVCVKEKQRLEQQMYSANERELGMAIKIYDEKRRKMDGLEEMLLAKQRQLEAERDSCVKEKQGLAGEKKELEKKKREFEERTNELEKAKQGMEGEKKALEKEKREFQERMNELEKAKQDMEGAKRSLEKENREFEEKTNELAKAKQDMEGEKRALAKEKREFEEIANDLEKAKQDLQGEKKELERKKREFEEKTNELAKAKQDLQGEKRAFEKEKREFEEKTNELAKAKQDLQGEKRALEKEKREFDEIANDLAKAKQEMEGAKKELEQKTREFEETMNELEKEKQDLQGEKRALEKEKKSIDEERRDLAEAKRGRFEERCQEKANKVNAEERRKVEEKEVSLVEREERSQLEERDMREKEVGELISELNSQRAFFLEKSKTWKAEQEKVRGQLKETEQIMAEQMARWQTRERTIMEEFTRLQEAKEEVERRYASLQEQLSLMEERTAQPLADALEALEEAKRREKEQMGELERERRERQQIEKDYERLAQQNSELTQHVAESRGLKERLEHLQSELLKWRRIGEEARQRAETQYKELKRLDEERQRLLQKCSSQTEGMHFGHAFFAAGVQSDSRHSEEASRDKSDRHVSSDSENVDRDGMAKPQERAGPRRATIRDEKENSEDTRRPGEGQSGTPPAPPRGSEAAPDTPQSAGLFSTVGDPDREGNAVNERTEERQRVEAEPKDERSRDVLIERLRRLYSEECASSRRLAAEGAKYRQQLRQVMKRLVVVTKAMEEANDLREKRQRMQQQKRRGKVSSE